MSQFLVLFDMSYYYVRSNNTEKRRCCPELLDMSLKSITAAWENGELANCGFTASEVSKFPISFSFLPLNGVLIVLDHLFFMRDGHLLFLVTTCYCYTCHHIIVHAVLWVCILLAKLMLF